MDAALERHLTLSLLPGRFAVCRLRADSAPPAWAFTGEFVSVTRTTDELSVVCAEDAVPAEAQSEGGWRCLKVEGPFDFALTGILAALLSPLASAKIPIFAVSTFDTDYLMVKERDLEPAIASLRSAGHTVGT